MENQLLDVTIIGGGPAGLNAALVLGRARKKVTIVDEGRPRNAVTRKVHGFLTRDGITPREFRRIAQEEIRAYPSVSFAADTAVAITGTDGQFQIETAQGQTFASKKILFAVGMKDEPLDIPGLQEVYGTSAFVCPYCDGWELRDQPLVIITKTGIFFRPELVTGSDLPRKFGCQITEWGAVVVDDFGMTNVPGVYSAGDAASRMHQAIVAAAMGAFVAAVINNELNTEAWGRKG